MHSSIRLPLVSDVRLSVDDELLTIVYRLSGRFFGLFRMVCCVCIGMFKSSFCMRSVEHVLVGDIDIGAEISKQKAVVKWCQ